MRNCWRKLRTGPRKMRFRALSLVIFNMPPRDLPAGQALASLGYQEVFELHQHVHGEVLPPTCKGATRHDTALLHPALVPLFLRAWVLQGQQLFDAHDPLCFQLRLCENRPCRHTWRLPKPWAALGPDRAAFADAFRPAAARLKRQADACASVQDVEAALLSFSKEAEDAVQMALVAQNKADPLKAPHTTLPRSYRGRCVNRKPLQRELPCLLKPARSGGYQPDVEVTSVLGRMKVRQVRRVRTLQQGLLKTWTAFLPLIVPLCGSSSSWNGGPSCVPEATHPPSRFGC